ncbi:SGNH/GDSL hydrolase family protein [Carnobacterium antarcticum]|uniref:SGNH/GDSL hydrolase family protein n=1 Tax=Carnobacterium antarcticum TaxID=2126436 RepID=A0ABW4NJV7_9LACT|nr:SGNH/GDSL hydrolase family protein [Carnobacterium sp. CP1]ALV21796.1 lipase/acylhydrolase family protein [Carnobacterium sp. CP1]
MELKKEATILFIGDSITDANRRREDPTDLGYGYPLLVAAALLERYPELNLSLVNRGIDGNKITDLANRWEEDCLALDPDIVSILIGINDTWHNVGTEAFGTQESIDRFEFYYRILLQTVKERTNAQIILMEPFVLPHPIYRKEWRIDLNSRIQVIRKLAKEYETDFVALDERLNALGMKQSYAYWTGQDGVHPTLAGHAVIAKAWLEQLEN